MSLTIDVTAHHGITHVAIAGELDMAAKPQLQTAITDQLADTTVNRVVIDMVGVTFLDSAGIGALVSCKRLGADAGKHVQAVGAAGQIADVLELTGVTAYLAADQ